MKLIFTALFNLDQFVFDVVAFHTPAVLRQRLTRRSDKVKVNIFILEPWFLYVCFISFSLFHFAPQRVEQCGRVALLVLSSLTIVSFSPLMLKRCKSDTYLTPVRQCFASRFSPISLSSLPLYPRAFSHVPPSVFVHFKLPYAIIQIIAFS